MNNSSIGKSKRSELFGLVLAGGKSQRMESDKSLINYHGESQTEYCVKLLSKYSKKVFVSNRKDQSDLPEHSKFSQIHDIYLDCGPLGGILSAMAAHPRNAWFVLACDLPYVNSEAIDRLIKCRDENKYASAYQSFKEHLPEPLCAIYEPSSHDQLLKYHSDGIYCPRKILTDLDIVMIDQLNTGLLDNINTPEEHQIAAKTIKKYERCK